MSKLKSKLKVWRELAAWFLLTVNTAGWGYVGVTGQISITYDPSGNVTHVSLEHVRWNMNKGSNFTEKQFTALQKEIGSLRDQISAFTTVPRSPGYGTMTSLNGLWTSRQVFDTEQLRLAALLGDSEKVGFLVEHELNVNEVDKDGWNALHLAAGAGYLDVVRALLQANANVNALDKDDWNALHWAAFKGQQEVVELLLEKDVDINAKDILGRTPMNLARQADHLTISTLLEGAMKESGEVQSS